MDKDFGFWHSWESGWYHVVLTDGVLCVFKDPDIRIRIGRKEVLAFKRRFCDWFFGDREFLIGCKDEYVDSILSEGNGKSEDEVRQIANRCKEARKARHTKEAEEARKWAILRDKFDGVVIGLDSKIDVYGSGFSVRVLFGSDVGFLGRRKFLSENRREFLRWVIHEINDSKGIVRRIGDIGFYKPVEIVNLRANEVEVKFEIKEGVA